MKSFHCDVCELPLYFENDHCSGCGMMVGYFPDRAEMATLRGNGHRRCRNFEVENVCNWMVSAADPSDYCLSCRLTRVIPDLAQPASLALWYRTEAAKRRLIVTLLEIGLPVIGKEVDAAQGLAFEFRADDPWSAEAVLTGHNDGLITLNIAEADDAERERRRLQLHEPYRTLLGHFRHEIGHYYWDVLIKDSECLDDWRRLFGDERADYEQSLQQHYKQGPPADWQHSFVSSYASVHPWEDWAETWAHYLHMVDSLETAAAAGISLQPRQRHHSPVVKMKPVPDRQGFDALARRWIALTLVLNNLNRSMGLNDAYPFVLSATALAKLCFVHQLVTGRQPEQCRVTAAPGAAAASEEIVGPDHRAPHVGHG
jgi:hypothetical protein